MQKIQTALCFTGMAEEAAKFYTSVFNNSKIIRTAYYGEETAKKFNIEPNSVLSIVFQIEGQEFLAFNGPDYQYSPGISFSVYPQSEKDFDTLWEKLSAGGSVLMVVDKYPWSEKYGWCSDKFGVSWQLMLDKEVTRDLTPSFLFVKKLFDKGEEALNFYTSIFRDSKIGIVHKDSEKNTVMYSDFTLEGKRFALMEEGSIEHKFDMTPAVSFMVNCKTQEEIDYYWEKLLEGGGKENRCGWLEDKYGVTWQIDPDFLVEMTGDPDSAKAEKVMKAMMGMVKLDIAELKAAYES